MLVLAANPGEDAAILALARSLRQGPPMFGMLRAFGALMFNSTLNFSPSRTRADSLSPSNEPKCTVLAIDDDAAYLEVLGPLLREEGFNVLVCTSGAKALNMLRYGQLDIQVVLLDYNMPQLDGDGTLQYLRQLSPQIKVVAVTGVDTNLLPESFQKGVDNCIHKPCGRQELVAAINSLLGSEEAATTPGLS